VAVTHFKWALPSTAKASNERSVTGNTIVEENILAYVLSPAVAPSPYLCKYGIIAGEIAQRNLSGRGMLKCYHFPATDRLIAGEGNAKAIHGVLHMVGEVDIFVDRF